MSKFVERPPKTYDKNAFDAFSPRRGRFDLNDAHAMMWMCQLAYESDAGSTIDEIGPIWGFKAIEHLSAQGHTIDTRAIVGERHDCTVVAFEGTDPALVDNLITDARCKLTPDNVHEGFQLALAAIWPKIETALHTKPRPVFFAGHSLGAALAVLAAEKANEVGKAPAAIYTFGMPRSGGAAFATRYNAKLGDRTYRLVHGGDTVPCIPDAIFKVLPIQFRHVGRMLKCTSGGRFDRTVPLSDVDCDDPRFKAGARENLRNRWNAWMAGRFFAPTGPGAFGRLLAFLPFAIRDHLPDRYLSALKP